jgi:hypothetical protein
MHGSCATPEVDRYCFRVKAKAADELHGVVRYSGRWLLSRVAG